MPAAKKKKKTVKSTLTEKQRAFLVVLREELGVVSRAAERYNLHRNTHYLWMKNPAYAAEVADIEEDCLDLVEFKNMENILAGDVQSILHYLKTKGRKRGYGEKTDFGFTDPDGKPVETQVMVIAGKKITFS